MTGIEYSKTAVLPMVVASLVLGLSASAQQTEEEIGINSAKLRPSVTKQKRDPFWPVGYVPKSAISVSEADPSEKVVVVDNSWNEAMKKVVINGVSNSANNEYCAVINGEIRSIGDTVTVSHAGSAYTWAVDAIDASGAVKLRRVIVK